MAKSRTARVMILSSGQALTALVAILSGAALTRLLSQADFGSYRQAMLAYSFAAPFAMLGFDRALYRFLPGESTRTRGILIENLILLTIGGALLSAFLLFGGNHLLARRFNNPLLISLVSLMVLYPLFMFPASALPACLLARERTGQLSTFNVLSRLMILLIVVIPCFFWPYASTPIIGNVAGVILTTSVAVYLMVRACPDGSLRPTWDGIKKQFYFSVPLGLSAIVGTTSISLDQVMVSLRCPPETFAVYTIGAMEIPLIGIVTGSITSVVMVDYARFHKENNKKAIIALIHQAMSKSAVLILPVMMFLLCVAPELIRLLFGKGYEASAVPFRIYLLLLPIRTITFGAVLQATGNSKYILVQSVMHLIANAIMGWFLIGIFGAPGAALGAVLAMYLVAIPYLVWSFQRVLKASLTELFPWRSMATILIITALPSLIVWLLLQNIVTTDIIKISIAVSMFFPLSLGALFKAKALTVDDIKQVFPNIYLK